MNTWTMKVVERRSVAVSVSERGCVEGKMKNLLLFLRTSFFRGESTISRLTLVADKDAEKSKRVMQAMFQMDKIEIEGLKRAYAGE